jgi:CSLREA domain-containing protein
MLSSHTTPRAKGFRRLLPFLVAGGLLVVAINNSTVSAREAEPGFLRRLLTAPIATVQQIFKTPGNLAAAPAPLAVAPAMAATIIVNSTGDATANDGVCTLREAITAANSNAASGAAAGECVAGQAGLDNIDFNLGAGTPSIALTSPLPAIAEPVSINGATGGSTRVELNGTAAAGGIGGLVINAAGSGSTIQSLVINRFPANTHGILINPNSNGNTIKNCFIGVDTAGAATSANAKDGIHINDAANNIIGGATAADRNVISGNGTVGNDGSGVVISGTAATGNKVSGNYIGTDAAGTTALPNVDNGVFFTNGAANNFVGGSNAGEGNVISGNNFNGVFLNNAATNNQIRGNFIGIDATGTAALPNKVDGVQVSSASNNTIGGTTTTERNVISGNQMRGIQIVNGTATGNKVIGNFIGMNAAGTATIGNAEHGVFVQDAPGNTVGGTTAAEGNVIAGNGTVGSPFTSIGVRVIENPMQNGTGNKILGNSIFDNVGVGIGLSFTPPTANDPLDADTGGNNHQNFPVLSCAISGNGVTTIQGSLNSLATTSFRIEFFSSPACDPSGNGEGKTFLGSQDVTTNASGDATINATLAATVTAGQVVTATATKLDGNGAPVETSEFSLCRTVTAAPTLAIGDVALAEGDAGTTNFVFTVTLSNAQGSCAPVTVNYATASGTATVGTDYASTSGTLTFNTPHNSNTLTQTITVAVVGDMTVEGNETFFVNLSNPTGASISDAQGQGTINNDDVALINITDTTVTEGDSGTVNATFTVSLTKPSASAITVQYQTANNSATAPSDFTALALSTLTFNAGEQSKQITVVVNGDMTVEGNDIFHVNLSNASGATINDAQGQGTITNDDSTTVSISDATVTEGNSGTVNANSNVTLTKASAEQITVSYATANNTATTGDNDFAAASGTVTFAPGETSKPVAVTVNGDAKVEANETFHVNLSNIVGNDANVPDPTFSDNQGLGTINNDDSATIAINDVMVTEGNSGTVNATFSVSLTGLVDQAVTVNFATANNSATAPSDFVATSGTVTFAANSNAPQSITVMVNGDTSQETDETFFVNLTPNSFPYANVTIADNQGLGTIKNDDSTTPPTLTASMTDPFVCNSVGGLVEVTAKLTNPNATSYAATFSVTLPSQLTAVPNSCTTTTGNCIVTPPNQIAWSGTLAANQTVTITYQANVSGSTPNGQLIVINSTGSLGGQNTSATASGTVSCPPNNINAMPEQVEASGQKTGSVLVYPYYTSKAATKADTRLNLANIGNQQAIVHLFLIAGNDCQAANLYVCLTPFASMSFKASEYDPDLTGWMLAVVVDRLGKPIQNNSLIGNAFVNNGSIVDNYGAVSFAANSAALAAFSGDTAKLLFNDAGYDAVPDQHAVELQSPVDVTGQQIVTVGMLGNLTTGAMSGASQVGIGLIINGNETPAGSFGSLLSGSCQASATISKTSPRVPNTMERMIPSGHVGTMRFATGPSVGLLMTPRGGAWSGIRGLHFTHKTFSTITIPTFPPSC